MKSDSDSQISMQKEEQIPEDRYSEEVIGPMSYPDEDGANNYKNAVLQPTEYPIKIQE